MRSREFNKRIEIWTLESVSDGFGGNTVNETLLSNSWAKISSIQPGKSNNLKDFGIVDGQKSIIITVRKRNDLEYNLETMFIRYRGLKYTISTAPTNINFDDAFIVFIGHQETVKSNSIPTLLNVVYGGIQVVHNGVNVTYQT